MAIIPMNPEGGVNTTGNYKNMISSPGGTPGTGWQLTYSVLYSAIVGGFSDEILLPMNARECSVTYGYTGAATVTVNLQASNNNVQELASNAATKLYGPVPTSIAPQIVGGGSQSAFFPSAPSAIRAVIGGSAFVGTDVLIICISAISKINV
jgi:hypothetical protein